MLRAAVLFLSVFACCQSASGGIITILDLNTDPSNMNTLVGGGGGSGVLTYVTGPTTNATPSTTARYTVSNVDLDGDPSSNESFTFETTFSSSGDVNFNGSRTELSVGADEQFSLNETITFAFNVISDTSMTHDVVFKGMFAIEMFELENAGFDINGNAYVINSGVTPFSAPGPTHFVSPTFLYESNPPGGPTSGSIHDWHIEFDVQLASSAVPEPSAAGILLLASLLFGTRRKRRLEGKRG